MKLHGTKKRQRHTNRFEYGDSVGADVPAGSDAEASDQTSAQIAETQSHDLSTSNHSL